MRCRIDGPFSVMRIIAYARMVRSIRTAMRAAARRFGSVTRAAAIIERRVGLPAWVAHNYIVAGPAETRKDEARSLRFLSDIGLALQSELRLELTNFDQRRGARAA